MPIHDWSRADPGIFHAFHLVWLGQLQAALNGGLLPSDYYALAERPSPRQRQRTLAIRHVSDHRMVALVEIISSANKDRWRSIAEFINKTATALHLGTHVTLVDLFPPGAFDPAGMHGALWEQFNPDNPYAVPEKQPLTLAAYAAGNPLTAYVDPLAVGDTLPEMPLFLTADHYIALPLEPAYVAGYAGMPAFWREVVEGRRPPP
jgi:hypothetical protein